MATTLPERRTIASPFAKVRQALVKVAGLTFLAVVLGAGQNWMASRYYGPPHVAGFPLGLVQGALMPAALPSLLMGHDVAIYASSNNGRFYKIGYILGINLCGMLFFGFGFWQPGKTPRPPDAPRG